MLVCENATCDITYGSARLRTRAVVTDENIVTKSNFLYIFSTYLTSTFACETLIVMLTLFMCMCTGSIMTYWIMEAGSNTTKARSAPAWYTELNANGSPSPSLMTNGL